MTNMEERMMGSYVGLGILLGMTSVWLWVYEILKVSKIFTYVHEMFNREEEGWKLNEDILHGIPKYVLGVTINLRHYAGLPKIHPIALSSQMQSAYPIQAIKRHPCSLRVFISMP